MEHLELYRQLSDARVDAADAKKAHESLLEEKGDEIEHLKRENDRLKCKMGDLRRENAELCTLLDLTYHRCQKFPMCFVFCSLRG